MKTVDSSPHPSMLIESLRDFGYSLESALADVIDNSIAANASRIDVFANFSEGEEYIAVLDNGEGMDSTQLFNAMRLGSQNPLHEREKHDLGRFGLGLKTASFSQCRNLTVISRKSGQTVGAGWDLDYVARENKWDVLVVEDFRAMPGYEQLTNSGTLVVWQQLDRLTEKSDRKSNEEFFEERMTEAMDHLALVYHRFLRREGQFKQISISINGRPIEPIDPFLTDHPGVQQTEEEVVQYNDHKVKLKGYTLPAYNRMAPEIWKRLGGKEGHVKNQGFYVYRERRLIIWGTWFNLAPKSELNKLARVKVDIGNDTDSDWKIDVLKSSATPPLPVRRRMKQIVQTLTEGSKRVHSGKKRRSNLSPMASGWITIHEGPNIRFVPNREHPIISSHFSTLSASQLESFELMMSTLASTLPMDQIHARMSHKPEEVVQSSVDIENLTQMVHSVVEALSATGMTFESIRSNLRYEEPFRSQWKSVEKILDLIESSPVEMDK